MSHLARESDVSHLTDGKNHSTRSIDRLAYAHDASHYLMVPSAVATPMSVEDVADILRTSALLGQHLTFRSGGTSLSGQAQTSGLLVDTRRHFREVEVLDGGRRVRARPGATVRQVNTRLAALGYKLGPDPASESACTIGGVIANNSSGMVCGTENNTYRTIESLVLVLLDGTIIDTGAKDADNRLRIMAPSVHAGLIRLRDRVRGNPQSVRRIEQQYSMKNTMGYGLNAFTDFAEPVDILTHLVVGSEGTMGFIAEATFRTIPIRPHAATGLLLFATLEQATRALPDLVDIGLSAIELLDATSLAIARQDPKSGGLLPPIHTGLETALLVEYQELTPNELQARLDAVQDFWARLPLLSPAALTEDPLIRRDLWHIRKGLYPAVAGSRPSGTTALLEDIAVPVPALASTCITLMGLFRRHGYEQSVIFGHAKDGNIHFLLNERFDDPTRMRHYAEFTEDMVDLVLKHGGTLKAEHGTGRIMAPFVRRQYGDELYDVMREIKALFDPAGILNPGTLISDDEQIHLRHLKITPTVEAEVDRCVECGYCEPVCPSKDLTLTPRQRIVVRRELERARQAGDHALARELEADYEYDGIQTCAADGMCQTACPVLIDTGALVARLRAEQHKPLREAMWRSAAKRWGTVNLNLGRAMTLAARTPPGLITPINRLARGIAGKDSVPMWDDKLPLGGKRRTPLKAIDADIVFFPSCVGTMFGPAEGGIGASVAFLELCGRAGIRVLVPEGIDAACCGTPWKSKGMTGGYDAMRRRIQPWLWRATDRGRLSVVCDAASCTEGLKLITEELLPMHGRHITVVDSVQYAAEILLPRLTITTRLESMALHPTCSSSRLGINDALLMLAKAIAIDVEIPHDWNCCGFAGDRGMLHPELTESATRLEAENVRQRDFTAYASCNRTCEIGLARATGAPYRHILEFVVGALDSS